MIGERRGLPAQPGRAAWALYTPRHEYLHVRAHVHRFVPGYECVPVPHPRCGAFALHGGGGGGHPAGPESLVWLRREFQRGIKSGLEGTGRNNGKEGCGIRLSGVGY